MLMFEPMFMKGVCLIIDGKKLTTIGNISRGVVLEILGVRCQMLNRVGL